MWCRRCLSWEGFSNERASTTNKQTKRKEVQNEAMSINISAKQLICLWDYGLRGDMA